MKMLVKAAQHGPSSSLSHCSHCRPSCFPLMVAFAFYTTQTWPVLMMGILQYQNPIPNKQTHAHTHTHITAKHKFLLESAINSSIGGNEMVNTIQILNMKTILIICILLASILFSPSSIIARELAQSGISQTGNSNNPAIKPGTTPYDKPCNPSSPNYHSCVALTKLKLKCDPKDPNTHCKGNGQTGNPNNPVVKPGTGATDPNRPIFKCDPSSPKYGRCLENPKPKKHECVPSPYKRCPHQDP